MTGTYSGIRVRSIKCYALTSAEDKMKMNELRMKGLPRRVHDSLNLDHFDSRDQGKCTPIMSSWTMGPTPELGVALSIKSRTLASGLNFKRRSLVC